jgi:hypothetical protein
MSLKLVDRVRERVQSVFADMQDEANVRNLSAASALREFTLDAIANIVKVLQSEADASGAEKKAAAMEFVKAFYDQVIEPLDLPGPDAIIDPLAKSVVLKIADYAIDSLIAFLRSNSLDSVVNTFRTSE